jgi:hypothetical protein
MNLTLILEGLNNWLFKPQSPTPIALVRIFIGLILLQNLVLHLLPDFSLYFGDHAVIPIDSIVTKYWGRQPTFDLMLLLPAEENWRFIFFLGLILAAFFMTVGFASRISMICVFLGLSSIDSHFELNQNDGDVFLRLACMILAFSNAGDAFSVDNLIRAFREDWRLTGFAPRLSAPWAQRWYQLQLAFVYCHTFFCKLAGRHWIDGWAVYFASRYDDCQRFMFPAIFDNPFTLKLLTWFTLVIELALWTLVWFKDLRYWVLLGGLCLHSGIELTMNLPMFEWLFMSSYFAFVEPQDLTNVMDLIKIKIHKYFGTPVNFVYDGNSLTSVHTVGVLHRLDIFGFLKLLDSCHIQTEHLSTGSNKSSEVPFLQTGAGQLRGFNALRWMALRLPLLWLTLPFFYVPPFSWFTKNACRWIWRRRKLIFEGSPHGQLPDISRTTAVAE